MAGQNLISPSDTPEGLGSMSSTTSFEDLPKNLLKLFKEVEAVVDRITKNWETTSKDIKTVTGQVGASSTGAGKLGLGSFTPGQVATGLGLGVVATGAVVSSMAPNTMSAVTQAMAASTYAGFSGMSNLQATRLANRQIGMGATSAMGPTMAAMQLSNVGLLAGGTSSNNVMGQLAGLSAMTGMSNQQAAAAAGSINGMNFLRLGINVRDSKGNLLPPNQIINSAWNALTRGRPYTQQQVAATFLSPNGAGYQTLQAIAGGDQNLLQMLQSGFMARAKIGKDITPGQMGNAQTMLGAIGVDSSSPLYANFKNNTSQANLLAQTQQGLVGGYNTALNANADLTNKFADVAGAADGVTKALMGLKGFLQTFPGAGSVGGTISGVASTAVGLGASALITRSLMNKLAATMGKTPVKSPSLLSRLFSGAKTVLSPKNWALDAALVADETAAAVAAPESAGASEVAGQVGARALISKIFANGMKGPRGGGFDHGDMGHGGMGGPTGHQNVVPVPKGTPVTSPYGARGGGAKTKGFHPGVDYGVQTGTNVYAHDSGTVTIVGNGGGYGNYIEIDHGSYRTRYAHLKSIGVSRGQKVSAGQVIAKSGNTGNSTGPHLHFEVLVNGKKVNPAPYLVGAGTSSASSSAAGTSRRGNSSTITDLESLSSTGINSVLDSFKSNSYSNLSNMFGANAAKNLSGKSSLSFIKGQTQVTPGVILGTGSQQAWARTLLTKLGKPLTPENIKALTTWAAWEGGQWHNSAHYNPLNTTQPEAGATNMNKEGVKSYKSWDQGYTATVQTLNNGRYKAILSALAKGNNTGSVLQAVDHSPWGSHIPGYGGPTGDLGTASISRSLGMPSSGRGGPVTVGGSGSTTNVNFNVKFYAQHASVADAKRFIKLIEDEAKKSNLLKTIGSVG
jgi:murein DD-endopeptidase MepM/ murein hydrolase activator NlpD